VFGGSCRPPAPGAHFGAGAAADTCRRRWSSRDRAPELDTRTERGWHGAAWCGASLIGVSPPEPARRTARPPGVRGERSPSQSGSACEAGRGLLFAGTRDSGPESIAKDHSTGRQVKSAAHAVRGGRSEDLEKTRGPFDRPPAAIALGRHSMGCSLVAITAQQASSFSRGMTCRSIHRRFTGPAQVKDGQIGGAGSRKSDQRAGSAYGR